MDPRLEGVTAEDLQAQFELASQIRDKTSAANEAVIRIRKIREQVNQRLEGVEDPSLEGSAKAFLDRIGAIEEEVYQVKNQSDQDPLNFPIKLNNRLAALRRSVETGDARPTEGAYRVFEELSVELDGHLENLEKALSSDLDALNQELQAHDLEPVEANQK